VRIDPPDGGGLVSTAQPSVIRVFVADDHAVVRSGLRAVLDDQDGVEVVGEAANAEDAVARVLALAPDVVLLDVRMGDGDDASGIDACRRIRSELPGARVIMFTSFGDRDSALSAIMGGASGFLTKNVPHARLIEAVRAAARGETTLDPSVTAPILDALARRARSGGEHDDLSEREREVLTLIARGYTNKEIARELVISPFTARNHVTRILEKLGVSRRSEAAVEALRLGLLDRNTPV
jgi:two-component system, NarL family, response regulator DevR